MLRASATSSTPAREPRSDPRPLVLLFLVSLALRVAYVWVTQGIDARPVSDSLQIDTIAWNLARGAGFSYDGANGPYPTSFVPPLVPWLTSLLYRIVGHQYFAALLLQCVLGALTPVFTAVLANMLFGGSAGKWAGWLAAVHPLIVFFTGYLLTEATFLSVLTMTLAASAAWLRTPRPGRAFGVGLLWGLATLTRPTALLGTGLVALWAWAPLGLTVAARDRVRQIALLFAGLLVVLAPWSIRNSVIAGRFVPIKTGGPKTFLDANNPEIWNDPLRRGSANDAYQIERYARAFRGRSEVEVDSIASAEAWKFLNAHRGEWGAMAAVKLARFWRVSTEGGGTGSWQDARSPLTRLLRFFDPLALWSAFVLPLALWGALRSLAGPRRWFQSIALAFIVYFTVIGVVFWGSLRMRAPVEPLVLILAAAGIEDVRRRLLGRSRGIRVIEGGRRA
jgi:4-amino-4-deoxy-L-arabinose transferase-like glycosyltransferase